MVHNIEFNVYNQQVFAERYRMKFIIKEEVGVTASTTDDSEMEDEEDEVI